MMDRCTHIVRAFYDGFNPDGSPFTSELTIFNGELMFIDYLEAEKFADQGLDHIMEIAYGHEEVNDEDFDMFMLWVNPCHQKISVDEPDHWD